MNNGRRILFVLTPAFHPNAGGVQMSTYKLGEHFARLGHKVGVFSFEAEGHIEQEFAQMFSARESGNLSNKANLHEFRRTLQLFAPEVVINQMPYDHVIGDVLAAAEKPLLIACLRNTLFSVKNNLDEYALAVLPKIVAPVFRNRIGRRMLLMHHRTRHRRDLERILATYDHFVMFGPPNLGELRYFVSDFDPGKIRLIPNSVPHVAGSVPAKEKRVLWLGRVSYGQKRADLIIPLWKLIRAQLPDWELDVVGDGEALDDLRTEIAVQKIGGVRLHGRQKPGGYFRRAAVYIMTSSFEGFPNTVLEAQSFAAIPVLFNSFPIAEWLVNDGKNGFLIAPFDLDAMADRVVSIARNDGRMDLMRSALENAWRFRIESVGAMWDELIEAASRK